MFISILLIDPLRIILGAAVTTKVWGANTNAEIATDKTADRKVDDEISAYLGSNSSKPLGSDPTHVSGTSNNPMFDAEALSDEPADGYLAVSPADETVSEGQTDEDETGNDQTHRDDNDQANEDGEAAGFGLANEDDEAEGFGFADEGDKGEEAAGFQF